ncbi:MAG: phosphatase PAP2 family protein [Deltaproteobacteria bacterium]|nr:phosphatase PAP2 family protein [Deltaproteobacteria bacterium]
MSSSIARLACVAALLATLLATTTHARADVATDGSRKVHAGILAAGGAAYLGIEFVAKPYLTSPSCTICNPPGFDAAVRRGLVWRARRRANLLSTVVGYAMAPLYTTGMLVASGDPDFRRRYDDVVPVLEAAVSIGLLHHAVKFVLDRRRPFVHHAGAGHRYDTDDNASFFSGHTGLAFAVATAAGVVANERNYRAAPYIWAGGLTMAALTGYLRIAADKHWLSDVIVGSFVGVGVGVAIPLLFHKDTLAQPVATARTTGGGEPRFLSFGGAF